jgi:hypothetical protein
VTNPGPSSRNKIFGRLSGDLSSWALEEFMVHSSNKAMRIARSLCSAATFIPLGARMSVRQFSLFHIDQPLAGREEDPRRFFTVPPCFPRRAARRHHSPSRARSIVKRSTAIGLRYDNLTAGSS